MFQLSYFTYYLFGLVIPDKVQYRAITISVSGVVQFIFGNLFCYHILKVNEQLGQFFRMIKDRTYPYKTVKAVLVVYYVIYFPSTLVNILWY